MRAREAGATVRYEAHRGKGNVVRRMFSDIEADIYVLVDGDLTYDTSGVDTMVDNLLRNQLDMIIGVRKPHDADTFRFGHTVGNRLFTRLVSYIFGHRLHDVFSGYRVLSRRFVKSFPATSRGFEIEMELTVHALDLQMPAIEVPVAYRARPRGSHSKLRTIPDGVRIFWILFWLWKDVRPLAFFATWVMLLCVVVTILGYPLLIAFPQAGLVSQWPTAVLAAGLMAITVVGFVTGLILDGISKGRREMKRLHYLSLSAPHDSGDSRP